jgi:hypothetical protein
MIAVGDYFDYATRLNGLVLFMSHLPKETQKVILIKQMRSLINCNETFGEYYCRNYHHLTDDIEVYEFDKDYNINEILKEGNSKIITPLEMQITMHEYDLDMVDTVQTKEKLSYDDSRLGSFDETFDINYLWNYGNEKEWENAISHYWDILRHENISIEKEFDNLDSSLIEKMSVEEFYDFLYNKYFVWKFTAKNRLTTTRMQLEKYRSEHALVELEQIHHELFSFDKSEVRHGLNIASQIKGLGIAGASGLLSILFPKHFGTVDQFVVKSLCRIENLKENDVLMKMKPDSLRSQDGVILEKILIDKSQELNNKFGTDKWTPRMIDKVLWSIER